MVDRTCNPQLEPPSGKPPVALLLNCRSERTVGENDWIDIGDLENPRLNPALQAAVDAASEVTVEMTAEAVMDTAAQRTGLSSYGDSGFIPHLEAITECYETEGRLTPLGRMVSFEILVAYMSNRLKLEELIRLNPEIEDEKIDQPIVIAGMPRSGTTHLHNSLAMDPRLRSLPYYEALAPVPDDLKAYKGPAEKDPRWAACAANLAGLDQMHPAYKAMHEMAPDYAHEEIDLLAMDFMTAEFSILAHVPTLEAYNATVDQAPAYAYMKRALKALQWLRGPRRWVLKSPQHMSRLKVLSSTFPDGTFVLTHREPAAVLVSLATMVAYVMRANQKLNLKDTGQYWLEQVGAYLHSVARDRDVLPASRSIDIRFEDFLADNMECVRRIYETAGLPLEGAAESAIATYLGSHEAYRHGRVKYNAELFGLSADAIREEFSDYIKRFNV